MAEDSSSPFLSSVTTKIISARRKTTRCLRTSVQKSRRRHWKLLRTPSVVLNSLFLCPRTYMWWGGSHKPLVLVTAALYTTARATPGPRTRNAACMYHTIEGQRERFKMSECFYAVIFLTFFNQYLLFLINMFQYFWNISREILLCTTVAGRCILEVAYFKHSSGQPFNRLSKLRRKRFFCFLTAPYHQYLCVIS